MMGALRLSRWGETKEQGMYLLSTILFFVVFSVMNTSFTSAGYVFWLLAGVVLWYLNQHQAERRNKTYLIPGRPCLPSSRSITARR